MRAGELGRLAAAVVLALAFGARAHDVTPGTPRTERADVESLKAKIAEAKALDAIGRSGFSSSSAYIPQCVFRYAGCLSGCSSAEVGCYVVAYPDDARRTNYTACV